MKIDPKVALQERILEIAKLPPRKLDQAMIDKFRLVFHSTGQAEWFTQTWKLTTEEQVSEVSQMLRNAPNAAGELTAVVFQENGQWCSPAITGNGPRNRANASLIAGLHNWLPQLLEAAEKGLQVAKLEKRLQKAEAKMLAILAELQRLRAP